jgi:cellulose synthase/poly-beta-1,6-N-acetylglucosamine synthase-like glycosyltransferase
LGHLQCVPVQRFSFFAFQHYTGACSSLQAFSFSGFKPPPSFPPSPSFTSLPSVKNSPLRLLSVIIPARDEEGCIASTVEHLHLELDLRGVPHEIIVVDDGSTDRTWPILQEEAARLNGVPRKMEDRNSEFGDPRAKGAVTQVSGPGLQSPLQPVQSEAYFTGPLVTAASPHVWLEKYFSRGDYRKASS